MNDLNDLFGQMPNRPNHPDFWKLSQVLLKLDSGLDVTNPDEEAKERQHQKRLAEIGIDSECLAYAALQRSFRALGINSTQDMLDPQKQLMATMLSSVWVDAFAAGVFFEREGK